MFRTTKKPTLILLLGVFGITSVCAHSATEETNVPSFSKESPSLQKTPQQPSSLPPKSSEKMKSWQCLEVGTLLCIPLRVAYGYRQMGKIHGWEAQASYAIAGFYLSHVMLIEASYLPHITFDNQTNAFYFGLGGGGGICHTEGVSLFGQESKWVLIPSFYTKIGVQVNIHSTTCHYLDLKLGFPSIISFEYGWSF